MSCCNVGIIMHLSYNNYSGIANFLIFLIVKLTHRDLISNTLFRFFLIYFFHIFPALYSAPDLSVTSHLKA